MARFRPALPLPVGRDKSDRLIKSISLRTCNASRSRAAPKQSSLDCLQRLLAMRAVHVQSPLARNPVVVKRSDNPVGLSSPFVAKMPDEAIALLIC